MTPEQQRNIQLRFPRQIGEFEKEGKQLTVNQISMTDTDGF